MGLGGDDLLLGEAGIDLLASAFVEPEGAAARAGRDVVRDLEPGEGWLALRLGPPGDGLDEAAVRALLDGDGLLGTGVLLADQVQIDGLSSPRLDIAGLAEIARGGVPLGTVTGHRLVLAGVETLAADRITLTLLARRPGSRRRRRAAAPGRPLRRPRGRPDRPARSRRSARRS